MNERPTDELRVVKSRGTWNDESGGGSDGLPCGAVKAVQRKWLIPDGKIYLAKDGPRRNETDYYIDPNDGKLGGAYFYPYYQPMREEWRDLPEVEL